jgi:Tfp pilus assembly protein PilF
MLADQGIRLKEARRMIEQALTQDSMNPAYLDSYGWVLFKMGELDEAEKYIRMALEQMKSDVVIWDHLAEIYFAKGLREQAREMWEKALALDPDNAAIREKLDR